MATAAETPRAAASSSDRLRYTAMAETLPRKAPANLGVPGINASVHAGQQVQAIKANGGGLTTLDHPS